MDERMREQLRVEFNAGRRLATATTDILLSGLVSFTMTVGELLLSAKEKLTLKVQDTSIILEGARSVVSAPSVITAKAEGRNDLSADKSAQNDRSKGAAA